MKCNNDIPVPSNNTTPALASDNAHCNRQQAKAKMNSEKTSVAKSTTSDYWVQRLRDEVGKKKKSDVVLDGGIVDDMHPSRKRKTIIMPKKSNTHNANGIKKNKSDVSSKDDEQDGTSKAPSPSKSTLSISNDVSHAPEEDEELGALSSKKKRALPSITVDYLKAWMMSPEHIENPYPSEDEKANIMNDTGIELKQLTTWFANNRKRYWKPKVDELRKKAKESSLTLKEVAAREQGGSDMLSIARANSAASTHDGLVSSKSEGSSRSNNTNKSMSMKQRVVVLESMSFDEIRAANNGLLAESSNKEIQNKIQALKSLVAKDESATANDISLNQKKSPSNSDDFGTLAKEKITSSASKSTGIDDGFKENAENGTTETTMSVVENNISGVDMLKGNITKMQNDLLSERKKDIHGELQLCHNKVQGVIGTKIAEQVDGIVALAKEVTSRDALLAKKQRLERIIANRRDELIGETNPEDIKRTKEEIASREAQLNVTKAQLACVERACDVEGYLKEIQAAAMGAFEEKKDEFTKQSVFKKMNNEHVFAKQKARLKELLNSNQNSE